MQKPKKLAPKKTAPKKTKVLVTKHLTDNDKMVAGWRERLQAEMDRQKFSLRGLSAKADLGNSTVRYLLVDAEDVSLDALRKLSNALGVSITWLATGAHGFYVSDNSLSQGVRLLSIATADEADKSEPANPQGTLPVMNSSTPPDARALLVQNASMQVEGINVPVALKHVVLNGDVVIWSPSARQEVGELVVARTPRGGVVRRLSQTESGDLRLVANNSAFPQLAVKQSDILGAVVAIWRAAR